MRAAPAGYIQNGPLHRVPGLLQRAGWELVPSLQFSACRLFAFFLLKKKESSFPSRWRGGERLSAGAVIG